MLDLNAPFHAGELEAQRRAGVGDVASKVAGFIRPSMPTQHRSFFESLPFLVLSGADAEGRVWTTLVDGADGFVRSPDARTLTLATAIDGQDPLAASFAAGAEVGMIGIELASRRRNRLSGTIRATDQGFAIDVRQSFGNCPQYITERGWTRVEAEVGEARTSSALAPDQIARIGGADTLFIGTGQQGEAGAASNGYDASHRGGSAGFVQVIDETRLRIPDYAGNNFFNTIGNLLRDDRIGLVFVDFETGGLLQISGRATIDWAPSDAKDPAARRMIDVTVDAVADRPAAMSLRWSEDETARRRFAVTHKAREAEDIASFYLAPMDGAPAELFAAGQHLPIELAIPGRNAPVRRTYSLSGLTSAGEYRISVKREPQGLASRFLHDEVNVGDVIYARPPAGDFVIPSDRRPIVLASAGVGLTPMVAALYQVMAEPAARRAFYVHGARDGAHHALKKEVEALTAAHENMARRILYSRPRDEDRLGEDYDAEGRVTAEELLALNAGPDARYMLCGPDAFIADIKAGLEAAGVSSDDILFETFGPTS